METGQPKRKKQRMDEEEERQAPGTITGGGGEVPPVGGLMPEGTTTSVSPTHLARPSRRDLPPTSPPKKRKDQKAEMQQQPKRCRNNADMKRYITCKRWRMEEEKTKDRERDEEREQSQPGKEASEGGTSGPLKDPVNVGTPGWKSSQGDQGSGVFGTGGEKSLDEWKKSRRGCIWHQNWCRR